jgi:ABC-type transport system involved in multi-copper enzyme maturation permease subunit
MMRNPVLRRELLRGRLRQPKSTLIGVGTVVVRALGWVYFQIIISLLGNTNPVEARQTWCNVIYVQFALICLVAPSITANAIAQEKEQQTWEMLLFTRLLPGEIIFGKLIGRMAYIVGLLALGLPIALFCALHADRDGANSAAYITAGQFLGTYLTMLLCGLFYATFGLFMSWLLNRTLYAIISSYTFVVFGLIVITAFVAAILSNLTNDPNVFNHCPLMWFNPVLIIYEVTTPQQHLDTVFLIYGLIGYVLLSALMIWRMISGFRRFAYEP